MSADNRICIFEENKCWYVWMGSLSIDYYEPPCDAECFFNKKEALEVAEKMAKDCVILEGGVQFISRAEKFRGIEAELLRLTSLKKEISKSRY